MKYAYLFLSIVFNVVSYLLYKGISGKQTDVLWFVIFISGLILGGINVYFFTKALKDIPLSIAYPVFSGGCIFLMMGLSSALFGEKITAINITGAAVVVAGIALLTY